MTSGRFVNGLSEKLFDDAAERAAFLRCFDAAGGKPSAMAWVSEKQAGIFGGAAKPAWFPEWIDLVAEEQRPGKHPLHGEGAYYLLDPSSVFALTPLFALTAAKNVLDVCSSPGGKGILAWRHLHPELLVCNEVIGKRLGALISNVKRCNVQPVVVVSQDPRQLLSECSGALDVLIVDAPCSGQSLLVRGEGEQGAFHPATVNMNSNRQKRILASVAHLVKPGGHILYCTCTFSPEENERVLEWFLERFGEFAAQDVPQLAEYYSRLSTAPCYRLYPHRSVGAGAFTALLQRKGDGEAGVLNLQTMPIAWQAGFVQSEKPIRKDRGNRENHRIDRSPRRKKR